MKFKLTPARLSWLQFLAKSKDWVSEDRMPRRNQKSGFKQQVPRLTYRTYAPLIATGLIEREQKGMKVMYRITESGLAALSLHAEPKE